MRREELYLLDIVEAADHIAEFLRGKDHDGFLGDALLQAAVLQKLTVIGEAAARLPQSFHERHSQVEWADIIGFRNIAVHAYFSVEWPIVWIAATQEAPELGRQVAEILSREYPDAQI